MTVRQTEPDPGLARQRALLAWQRTALAAATAAAVLARLAWEHLDLVGAVPLVVACVASGLVARGRADRVGGRRTCPTGVTAACVALAAALAATVELAVVLGARG